MNSTRRGVNYYSPVEISIIDEIVNQMKFAKARNPSRTMDEAGFTMAMADLGIDFNGAFPERKIGNVFAKAQRLGYL